MNQWQQQLVLVLMFLTRNMVVDIGGGTTEIAVISLGGIVHDKSIRVAGDELTANIQYHMKTRHNIAIGDVMAEQIKSVGYALMN